jgi:hypothetical protein
MTLSTKSGVTAPKIHTAATIVAMEDETVVLPEVHHQDEEVIMEIMKANPKQAVTINIKTVPNQHAGTATSTDIVKKTVASISRRMLPAKVSMD